MNWEGIPKDVHRECAFRMVSGSAGHIMHQCSCYGVEDTSEVGLTKREAARRALRAWRQLYPNERHN